MALGDRNALLIFPTASDAATITPSHEVASLPASNLQDNDYALPWRSTNLTPYLVVDFGAAVSVGAVVLYAHNLTSAATLRYRLASSVPNLTAAPLYDSGTRWAWPDPAAPAPSTLAAVVARYLRIDIGDAANPDGFVQAGRLFAGPAFQPRYNYQRGHREGVIDVSERRRSRGGRTNVNDTPRFRYFEGDFSHLTEEEARGVLTAVDRARGLNGDVLLIPDPDDATWRLERCFAGRIAVIEGHQQDNHKSWARRFRIEEELP